MNAMGLKKSLFAVSLASALLLGATDVRAAQCGETKLSEQMGEMKDHLKAYKDAAKSEDWAIMAENRAALQELASSAKKELPFKAQSEPKAAQEKMQSNYQKGMTHLEELLDNLETAENSKDADKVMALMQEIGKHTKKGHRAFKQKCDDE
ncbi:cytochrome b562 [Oceanospirillum linum]|uniref:Cytochrome b562 n=1 Tax=Oceanospirillum linum TaxID=966 RepID=A0A1T1H7X4_OCELI|nr:cytochrome b562 [Oceanospirillum linum]OOV85943.1 hypothetical protein BTA35_0215640 [Oceanospirillum linum]SEG45466.1 Cytochrome b562 [Oleiphilus messinensis]SMP34553.1 Cytochrome b562 [Oceanospirillum linum]